jgi:hypothetical protein
MIQCKKGSCNIFFFILKNKKRNSMNLLFESSIKIKGLEKEVKKMFAWLHNLFESSGNLKGFKKGKINQI